MKPLEMCVLPNNSDMIDPYINGYSLQLENSAFISEGKLYLPVQEVSEILEINTYYIGENLILEDGGNKYQFDLASVFNVSSGAEELLGYLTRVIESVVYVEAEFFSKEINVTEAWEEETQSLYLATVLHYDGYRVAPISIYNEKAQNRQFHGMYLYVDAYVIADRQGIVLVENDDGRLYLATRRTMRFEQNKCYRFCFSYNAAQYLEGVPTGNLMELVEPDNRFREGNMIYTEESWKAFDRIEKKQNIQNTLGLDKDALIGMFKQYPDIVNDRKRLLGYLKDIFPGEKLHINLFMSAYDNGIIKQINYSDLDDLFVHKMVKQLVEENGIQMDYAIDVVCLWCDVYGSRILGKTFVAKKKYNPVIQGMLMERESQWISPELSKERSIGKIKYCEPVGWRSREAESPYVGTYYYPYLLSEMGMIWVTALNNPGHLEGDKFVYNGLVAGLCQGNLKNLIAASNVNIAGILGKKVTYNMKVSETIMEVDAYILPTEEYIYQIIFGEQMGLSVEMLLFENEFLECIKK